MTDTSQNVWGTPNEGSPVPNTLREEVVDTVPRRDVRTIIEMREQIKELTEGLAQAQAELANHRARKRKDLDDQYEAGRGEVIASLVSVLDNITGAKEHGDMAENNPLTPVLKSLIRALESLGLGAIGDVGADFDPRIHEALHVDYTDDVEGTKVSRVHQQGYATSTRMIRPALVTVVKQR